MIIGFNGITITVVLGRGNLHRSPIKKLQESRSIKRDRGDSNYRRSEHKRLDPGVLPTFLSLLLTEDCYFNTTDRNGRFKTM